MHPLSTTYRTVPTNSLTLVFSQDYYRHSMQGSLLVGHILPCLSKDTVDGSPSSLESVCSDMPLVVQPTS